ncbi:MAG: hypothetical protein J6D03_04720 [Clostridia bacterium]|nr:hypothetical protein [Clostridia bacterium]
MLMVKIIVGIMLLIGLLGILVVIGAGKLRTEEEIINDIEEELKYWEEYEKNKKNNANKCFLKRIFNFIIGGLKNG